VAAPEEDIMVPAPTATSKRLSISDSFQKCHARRLNPMPD
jgi:hypothetical protein